MKNINVSLDYGITLSVDLDILAIEDAVRLVNNTIYNVEELLKEKERTSFREATRTMKERFFGEPIKPEEYLKTLRFTDDQLIYEGPEDTDDDYEVRNDASVESVDGDQYLTLNVETNK